MRNKSHDGKLETAKLLLMDSARSMTRLFAGFFVVALLSASAYGSCIVSGDTSRAAAVSASSGLVSPSWFDSSSFVEFITLPLSVFDSFPLGSLLIYR